jgi:hypothetical protein
MSGGKILGNTASSGGGVYITGGTFTLSGGEISGNTAPGGGGGGVYVSGSSRKSSFTMSGGKIYSNATSNNSGGGVYVSSSTFTMSGGEIYSNTSGGGNGGGVYVPGSTFTKSGSGTITGYASDVANGNVVEHNNGVQSKHGHAVYISSSMRRETTAGPGINLDSRVSGAAGGWE